MPPNPPAPRPVPLLGDFAVISREKLRYGDTDRQGHVNNAVYSTFLETGRVEMLLGGDADLRGPDGPSSSPIWSLISSRK